MDARGRPRVEWIFTLVGHIFNAYGDGITVNYADISDMVLMKVGWVILIEREIMSHSLAPSEISRIKDRPVIEPLKWGGLLSKVWIW